MAGNLDSAWRRHGFPVAAAMVPDTQRRNDDFRHRVFSCACFRGGELGSPAEVRTRPRSRSFRSIIPTARTHSRTAHPGSRTVLPRPRTALRDLRSMGALPGRLGDVPGQVPATRGRSGPTSGGLSWTFGALSPAFGRSGAGRGRPPAAPDCCPRPSERRPNAGSSGNQACSSPATIGFKGVDAGKTCPRVSTHWRESGSTSPPKEST